LGSSNFEGGHPLIDMNPAFEWGWNPMTRSQQPARPDM